MDEVFDFVENERNEPRFNPRMLSAEKTSPGPIGLGTRFRAEMMMKGIGRPVVMTVELTAFERPRRLFLGLRNTRSGRSGCSLRHGCELNQG